MKRLPLILLSVASLITLTSCGGYWASTSIGPDIFIDDTYGGYYPGFNPNYSLNVPPPPPRPGYYPAPPRPTVPPPHHNTPNNRPGKPGNQPGNPPNNKPTGNNPGNPSLGGFRGQYGSEQ